MPEEDEENTPAALRAHAKNLEKQLKEAREIVAESEKYKRELAFEKAGIPDNGPGALFRKAYDGDINDLDALKTEAINYGVLNNPAEGELQQLQQIQNASVGGLPPNTENEFFRKLRTGDPRHFKDASDLGQQAHANGLDEELQKITGAYRRSG